MTDPVQAALLAFFADVSSELDPDDAPTRKHRSEDVYAKARALEPALRVRNLCRVLNEIDLAFWRAKAALVAAANEERKRPSSLDQVSP